MFRKGAGFPLREETRLVTVTRNHAGNINGKIKNAIFDFP